MPMKHHDGIQLSCCRIGGGLAGRFVAPYGCGTSLTKGSWLRFVTSGGEMDTIWARLEGIGDVMIQLGGLRLRQAHSYCWHSYDMHC